MGIAMAANVGGMASPIASPQNIIAVINMNPPPSWIEWFVIAIPMCILIDLCIWGILLWIYRPVGEQTTPPELYSNQHISNIKLTGVQIYVICVTFLTIFLWCIESLINSYVGEMGNFLLI